MSHSTIAYGIPKIKLDILPGLGEYTPVQDENIINKGSQPACDITCSVRRESFSARPKSYRGERWDRFKAGDMVCGIMERADFLGLPDAGKKTCWRRRITDPEKFLPIAVALGGRDDDLRELCGMYAALPLDHRSQVMDSTCLWVGVKILRGGKAEIVTWQNVKGANL